MKLNPDTTVARLLAAIPSSASVFEKLGIPPSRTEERSLQEVCREHGIHLEDLLQAIDELDWNKEFNGFPAAPCIE